MIAEDVAKQLTSGAVLGAPGLVKSGVETVCTYQVTGGILRMTVEELEGNDAARVYFEQAQRALTGRTAPVPNLGSAAFTRADGSTVTLKDNKVLIVDTSELPAGNDKHQISQSLSFEVMACWTG